MATKDKLVDLEDLKALKDWIVGRMDMYEDITNTLTWSDATWVHAFNTKTSVSGTGIKVAKLSVSKGEKYKVISWAGKNMNLTNTSTQASFSYTPTICVFANSSDNPISGYEIEDTPGNPPLFGECEVTIPAAAKYLYIFDHAAHSQIGMTAGDIIVEKAI